MKQCVPLIPSLKMLLGELKDLTASEQCKEFFCICSICHETKLKAIRALKSLFLNFILRIT